MIGPARVAAFRVLREVARGEAQPAAVLAREHRTLGDPRDRALATGTAREEPQDERLVTYAARLTKEEGLIDWTLPATRIHDRVRGLHPWPHAYSYVDGRRIIVWRTVPLGSPAAAPPGTVVHADTAGLHVATGDGTAVALLELQSEGGRPLAIADFLRGHDVPPGARFSSP